MNPALPIAGFALLISLLTTACTTAAAVQANPIPAQVRADAGRFIVVTLRNLTIGGVGTGGAIGIDFQNGAALFVEHCVIENWVGGGSGISFAPPSGVSAKLHVTDSVIKNNNGAGGNGGIDISTTGGGTTRVVIERTQVENNTYGINAGSSGGTILVEIKDSMIANSTIDGINASTSNPGAIVSIVVDHSSSLHNGLNGIDVGNTGAYVTLSDSTVAWNAKGLNASSGGIILSTGNNRVGGNFNGNGVSPVAFPVK